MKRQIRSLSTVISVSISVISHQRMLTGSVQTLTCRLMLRTRGGEQVSLSHPFLNSSSRCTVIHGVSGCCGDYIYDSRPLGLQHHHITPVEYTVVVYIEIPTNFSGFFTHISILATKFSVNKAISNLFLYTDI